MSDIFSIMRSIAVNIKSAASLFLICLTISLVICVVSAHAQNPNNTRRNVLLLVSDDQGREMMGAYGNAVVKTPNQDALARDGVRFTNAFSTVASCSPSRAALYTGMFQHQNGQYGLAHDEHNQQILPNIKPVGALLAEAGYRTAIIGKHHVKPLAQFGFQQVIPGAQGERDVQQMAGEARRIFTEAKDKPFFVVIGYSDPHRSGHSARGDEPANWEGFGNDVAYRGVNEIKYDPKQVPVPTFLPDQPEVRKELAEYYQAVSRLDQGIGMVMQALRDTNQLDNTLVLYLSDNGIPFPGAKMNLYDAGIHLPLLIRAPNQAKRGVVNNAMVSWVDITPTILEWAGVAKPKQVYGRSLLPVLEQENPQGRDEIFASHTMHEITMYYPMRVVRNRDYKLIWNVNYKQPFILADDMWHSPTWQGILKRGDGLLGKRKVADFLQRPEFELYDVRQDANEIINLAGRAEHKQTLEEMKGRIRTMMNETYDPWRLLFRDGALR